MRSPLSLNVAEGKRRGLLFGLSLVHITKIISEIPSRTPP